MAMVLANWGPLYIYIYIYIIYPSLHSRSHTVPLSRFTDGEASGIPSVFRGLASQHSGPCWALLVPPRAGWCSEGLGEVQRLRGLQITLSLNRCLVRAFLFGFCLRSFLIRSWKEAFNAGLSYALCISTSWKTLNSSLCKLLVFVVVGSSYSADSVLYCIFMHDMVFN